ncbi:MAG: tRNA (adenosine(37)-N6)-dimethylallyltransferase MiaA [Candidatus Brocadiia bacterium]
MSSADNQLFGEGGEGESPCWVLLGPTAAGKTAVSLKLARQYPLEIVSVDSMQVYRGMDIGTAKPAPEDRAEVPHHMVDVVDPEQKFNVARFRERALGAMEQIRARGAVPLLLCGTPFYLKALLWGLFDGPGADEDIRRKLRDKADREGVEKLHDRLRRVDPESAEKIDRADYKRIERALEVYEITGEPISARQNEFDGPPEVGHVSVGIKWPRGVLYERIEERVEQMLESGLVEEVRRLRDRLGPQASQAVGYKEVISWLEGEVSFDEAVRRVKRNTRHLAKSQLNWFRKLPVDAWVEAKGAAGIEEIADRCAVWFKKIGGESLHVR